MSIGPNAPATKNDKLDRFSHQIDGKRYWLASWYAHALGYASLTTFQPAIRKAKRITLYLGVPIEDNFLHCLIDDKPDIRLTRFACVIIAMQADGRKPMVKKARNYFFDESNKINNLLNANDYILRTTEREQLTSLHKLLNKRARASGVENFRYFQNEGYLGMYNCTASELRDARGLSSNEDIFDRIGTVELAANIFRITLTIERLKVIRNPSEEKAAAAHWRVGTQIRQMIKDNTGLYPEQLRKSEDLDRIQQQLQSEQEKINSLN